MRSATLPRSALRVGAAIGAGLLAHYLAELARRRSGDGLVDWRRVERIATSRLRRLPGTLSEAQLAAVAPAYAAAMNRIVPVLESRLGTPLPGVVERHAVVDRAGWARANLVVFRHIVDRLEGQLLTDSSGLGGGVAALANRFVTTQQIGFLLGYLGGRVLGQYDVALLSAEQAPGRLLFMEENVRQTARQLGVPVEHFRTWICLHEATHAFELEAHPWLRPYLRERLERQLALFLDEARSLQSTGLSQLISRWRSAAAEGNLSGFLSPEQRGLLRETQLVMSLLEGFSDWVMDEVGAGLLPDVAGIRARFEARRHARRGGLERIIARLTGLDLKLEQYARGERFVSGVARIGGDRELSHLWDGPHALPSEAEFSDPGAWIRRVVPEALPAPVG